MDLYCYLSLFVVYAFAVVSVSWRRRKVSLVLWGGVCVDIIVVQVQGSIFQFPGAAMAMMMERRCQQ